MRKIRILAYAAFIVVMCMAAAVTAYGEDLESTSFVYKYGTIFIDDKPLIFEDTDKAELADAADTAYEIILKGLNNCSEKIDISSCNIEKDQAFNVYKKVLNDYPKIFYVDKDHTTLTYSGNKALYFNMTYIEKGEALKSLIDEFNNDLLPAEENKIESLFESEMTQLEKALVIHEYMCSNFSYDHQVSGEIHDVYGILKERKGVCEAYTYLYKILLEDITETKSVYAFHDGTKYGTANHIWNILSFDNGKTWYHVDTTQDDTEYSSYDSEIRASVPFDPDGQIAHEFFIGSDNYFKKVDGEGRTDHKDWTADVKCEDEQYDELWWHSICTSINYVNGKWYCIDLVSQDSSSLFSYEDLDDPKCRTEVYNLGYAWQIALTSLNGKVYFNSDDNIYVYDTKISQDPETIADLKRTDDLYYCGLYADSSNDSLRYTYCDYMDEPPYMKDVKQETYQLPKTEYYYQNLKYSELGSDASGKYLVSVYTTDFQQVKIRLKCSTPGTMSKLLVAAYDSNNACIKACIVNAPKSGTVEEIIFDENTLWTSKTVKVFGVDSNYSPVCNYISGYWIYGVGGGSSAGSDMK